MSSYLTSENAEQEASCGIEEFPLDHKPEMLVRVKQLPVGELRRLAKAIKVGGYEGEKAEADMIAKSIVNADGSPVFTTETVSLIKASNAPMYASLMKAIGRANNKSQDEVNKITDDLEKN